jgi:hypothetical protein
MAGLSFLNNIIGPNIGIVVIVISLLLIGGIVIGVIALVKSSSSSSNSNLSKYIKATDKSIVIGLDDDSQKIVLQGNVDMTTGDVTLGSEYSTTDIYGKNIYMNANGTMKLDCKNTMYIQTDNKNSGTIFMGVDEDTGKARSINIRGKDFYIGDHSKVETIKVGSGGTKHCVICGNLPPKN